MKRRVGLLAALAMCVTVGGVYATWNYGESIGELSVYQQASIGLTGTGTASSLLKIKDGSNSLAFKVDDTTNDHIADDLISNGSITVIYEATAPVQYEITLYCNVTITSTDGNEYLKTTLGKNTLTHTYTMQNELSHEWTVNAHELLIGLGSYIQTSACELKTAAEYEAFAQEFPNLVSVNVHFSTTAIA